MGYLDIDNLYKAQDILMFKECYAMEKIHGTSAHVRFDPNNNGGQVSFFSGGCSHEEFIKLFDKAKLETLFRDKGLTAVTFIYGEAYGGKLQGMRKTYGADLKFAAFEVKIGDSWLNVVKAQGFVSSLGLEFVHYIQISTTLEAIDKERDADSVQAVRNGMGEGHPREGIVLRPLEEFTKNNGARVISKHKRDEFIETATPRKILDPAALKVLSDARAIATEWVTGERLNHILTKGIAEAKIENTGKVISLMVDDIVREAKGEIADSSEVRKEIAKATALLFKNTLKSNIRKEE
jgi:hypothetical protein